MAAPSLHYTRAELVAIRRCPAALAPPLALLEWVRRQIFPVLVPFTSLLPDTLPINLAKTHPVLSTLHRKIPSLVQVLFYFF